MEAWAADGLAGGRPEQRDGRDDDAGMPEKNWVVDDALKLSRETASRSRSRKWVSWATAFQVVLRSLVGGRRESLDRRGGFGACMTKRGTATRIDEVLRSSVPADWI